jgi:hypothetical protein
MRLLAVLIAVLAGSILASAAEENVTAGQTIIRSQEEAFRRDDAAAAYTFAAPGIKGMFQTPDVFMSMVRNGYAPVLSVVRDFETGGGLI